MGETFFVVVIMGSCLLAVMGIGSMIGKERREKVVMFANRLGE